MSISPSDFSFPPYGPPFHMGKEKEKTTEGAETYPDLRYGPLDYSVSKITDYLSPEQKETLQAFRDSIPTIWPEELTGIEKVFLSDATLCRYLRARDWSLSKAQKMIVETLKWRREYKPWSITAEEIDCELNNGGKLYRGGFDKYQRPILIMKPRHDNTGNEVRDTKVRALVYWLEKCICAGEANDREKMSLLIDFSKYSQMSGLSMIKMSMEVLNILSNHYPERLGTAWMVHPSWSFSLFWRTISPFLDPVTKKKIFFISKLKELLDWIDDDVLEEEYGGKNQEPYSYEVMKTRDDALYPPYNEDGERVQVIAVADDASVKKKKKKKKKSKKKTEESAEANGDESTSADESQTPREASEEPNVEEPTIERKKRRKHRTEEVPATAESSQGATSSQDAPSDSETTKD